MLLMKSNAKNNDKRPIFEQRLDKVEGIIKMNKCIL